MNLKQILASTSLLAGGLYAQTITENVELYPISVIAIDGTSQRLNDVLLPSKAQLSYDGGAILKQIPAFQSIKKSASYGADPVFRGFKYDQLNIVLNGAQCATAACPNRMDPPTSQMHPSHVERIEVLKGPYALRYGVGLGATINYISSPNHFSTQNKTYGGLATSYESNANIHQSQANVGLSGNAYDINLSGFYAEGGNYKAGNGEEVLAGFHRGSFRLKSGFKLNQTQQLTLGATYNRGRDSDFPALGMDLRKDDTWLLNARHSANFNHSWLKKWETTAYATLVDHLMDNQMKPTPRMMDVSSATKTQNWGGRTELEFRPQNGKWFVGADFKAEQAEGTRVRTMLKGKMAGKQIEDNSWQNSQITKAGIFSEYQLKTQALEYVFSARLEWNQAEAKDASKGFLALYPKSKSSQLNPSLSAGIIKNWEAVQVGFWVGRVQRSASLTERFINSFSVGQDPYELVGNPLLKAEKNNQADLTFQWKKTKTLIDVDVYFSYLQDFISSRIAPTLKPKTPMSPGVRVYTNIEKAYKTGVELSWKQQLVPHIQQQISLAYSYGQDLERAEALPEMAPLDLRYALRGDFFRHRLQPMFSLRYVAKQDRISKEFGEIPAPEFTVLDFHTTWQLNAKMAANVGINNLLDRAYFEHLSRAVRGGKTPIYSPGRSFTLGFNYTF
ncbi:TonB-dependent receptor domain-containing protein [Ornithobacterium rhinotracheale]